MAQNSSNRIKENKNKIKGNIVDIRQIKPKTFSIKKKLEKKERIGYKS